MSRTQSDSDAAWCELCEPAHKLTLAEMPAHLHMEHGVDMEAELQRWPDGSPVIVDETLTPGDFGGP